MSSKEPNQPKQEESKEDAVSKKTDEDEDLDKGKTDKLAFAKDTQSVTAFDGDDRAELNQLSTQLQQTDIFQSQRGNAWVDQHLQTEPLSGSNLNAPPSDSNLTANPQQTAPIQSHVPLWNQQREMNQQHMQQSQQRMQQKQEDLQRVPSIPTIMDKLQHYEPFVGDDEWEQNMPLLWLNEKSETITYVTFTKFQSEGIALVFDAVHEENHIVRLMDLVHYDRNFQKLEYKVAKQLLLSKIADEQSEELPNQSDDQPANVAEYKQQSSFIQPQISILQPPLGGFQLTQYRKTLLLVLLSGIGFDFQLVF